MQQGGSQYGVAPELTTFGTTGGRTHMLGISTSEHLQHDAAGLAEAASPISSRPPGVSRTNFNELVPVSGNFPDDDTLGGEEVDRGAPGNRWPRQETLALLKIRSEMDAAFRDATLKGPLWENVSRKLAELGYVRSAKKCKEKFENVHKYYKRTKEGRAGRQDGKSYRFFSQLEALHSSSPSTNTSAAATITTTTATTPTTNPPPSTTIPPISAMAAGTSSRIQPPTVSTTVTQIDIPQIIPELTAGITTGVSDSPAAAAGISFSSHTSSSDSDSEDEIEEGPSTGTRKRKRSGSSGIRKMMEFFEGLMKQVMEKQEAMQQRFLETIEKREQDRMIREEAWKRQEMARLAREHEIMAQERAMSASRDAAVLAFLQKITGQTFQMPQQAAPPPVSIPPIATPTQPTPPPPPPPSHQQQPEPQPQPQLQPQQHHHHQQQPQGPQQQQQQHHHQSPTTEIARQQPVSTELILVPEQHEMGGNFDPASSRWPKTEVLALIKLRSGLENRYQEAGPKGPLWEEISAGMQRLGYKRSAKRCKEKWENINKYFKKVKESNKKRPEDAKTCPYFHQLDALYRRKSMGSSSSIQTKQEQEMGSNQNPQERSEVLPIMPPPLSQPPHAESENRNTTKSGGNSAGGGGSSNLQVQTSNGGLPPSFFEEGSGGSGASVKKPEDIVKELMEQRQQQAVMDDYDDKLEEPDSDDLDQEEDDDDDEDEEERKMGYKIQFQRQNAGSANGGGAGSFLAMVQ